MSGDIDKVCVHTEGLLASTGNLNNSSNVNRVQVLTHMKKYSVREVS